ncbi:P-loop containing nucleoside triphosphate hydrolase protein [Clavulina sp. PMI_390]|nr:P-loop containing nucleoside triphosphate hydrolase protein [Clavulina sp. PMI_390]
MQVATKHTVTLLLSEFGVYFYRDIYPLCTYTEKPMDNAEGKQLWVRLGLLAFASLVVPLVAPREYHPIDPKHPNDPNPEQTASILSVLSFSFMDHLIYMGFKHPHIPFELLPSLCDYDRGAYLNERGHDTIRPRRTEKRRILAWRLLVLFRTEFLILVICNIIRALFGFLTPISLNRILHYIETNGKDAFIRPWVWIVLFFIAPMMSVIFFQLYLFGSTHLAVQVESIITQAVFEHALHIRMKSTPSDDKKTAAPKRQNRKANKGKNLEGKINNLISSDLDNIVGSRDIVQTLIFSPLQAVTSMIFLFTLLGWSALTGLTIMVLGMYVPGKIMARIHTIQIQKARATDARVQHVAETLGVIRLVKMFGYESKMEEQISEKRQVEIDLVRRRFQMSVINGVWQLYFPKINLIVLITFFTYTYFMGQALTASTVFSSVAVFDTLRAELNRLNTSLPGYVASKVSMDRLDEFLYETEVLDRFDEEVDNALENDPTPASDPDILGFRGAVFTWEKHSTPNNSAATSDALPSSAPNPETGRRFYLRIPGDLHFKPGVLNLIMGPTGCGKTSILLALLGEMHFISSGTNSWYNLPRQNGVAYAAQSPWILNRTIKDNILFGEEFDEARYKAVLSQCALEPDLELFQARSTLFNGINGGQKARISLARAVYSKAHIVLLDDILSALDVHTARSVVENCIVGDLLEGRTVVLVTHNISLTAKHAQHFVTFSSDGSISSSDSIADALSEELIQDNVVNDSKVATGSENPSNVVAKPEGGVANGKLVVAEEIALGRVTTRSLLLFLSNAGSLIFWVSWWGLNLSHETLQVFLSWWLGQWALAYQEADKPSEVSVPYYMSRYILIILISLATYSHNDHPFIHMLIQIWATMIRGVTRASIRIHALLAKSILSSTMRFLDITPTGRIVSRFTQDIQTVDRQLSSHVLVLTAMTSAILLKLSTIVYFTPSYLIPGIVLAAVAFIIGRIYMAAQLSVKRERSNRRSPIFSSFATTIGGLTSIRAFSVEATFRREFLHLVDAYLRASRAFYNLNRWIGVRINLVGAIFSTSLAMHLVYFAKSTNASIAGLQLSQAVVFSNTLLRWVRVTNDAEVSVNSLERIQNYLDIDHEAPPSADGIPPAAWPTSGNIVAKDLSARYSTDGPEVLHKLSFTIRSGEKIGVVGRTGSGKSSLTLSLLRLIPTEGDVTYDGRKTSTVNLEELRKAITIIPQQPELLSGTIRQNLDPFDKHDDAALNDALRAAGLFSLQAELPADQRITLDSKVASGGGNFSLGQRQIIALARALVRRSKVLILDEATASLDNTTDTLVQETLKTEFRDATLITVAHRLQTIMHADKIMVLDAGNIVEYDSPKNLLKIEGGAFKALVDGSGDSTNLYKMVA